ncbi:transposase (plasmid) [Flavobacterium sp. CBA20B-1]|uniref:transposase n=1 Tax=unclassified Flavobacterium TaxID=196869 RepID=UPI002224BF73|nr:MULTISPECIES: transposase [unclassified Flavobacterium]WCM43595.1 transposase [Flavobacterium sp. CBA20B-1]
MKIGEVLPDVGYSSGMSLQYCEHKKLDAWIPNFEKYPPKSFFLIQKKIDMNAFRKEGTRLICLLNEQQQPLYDKMHKKLIRNKAYHRRLVKRRSSTVEPVLGTLINFFNMKRINSRGMAQANNHVVMSSLSDNLKKHLRFIFKILHVLAQVFSLKQGNSLVFVKPVQPNVKRFSFS